MTLKNLDARQVARLLEDNSIVLVDVREPDEFGSEHIPGAVSMPLSQFDVRTLPDGKGRTIVFHCAVGGRSARAVSLCQRAGLPHDSHLEGGIRAWKAAGLPTER